MPLYIDKRTGKRVIQYQVGYKYVPDKDDPAKLIKRPKYKTEVVGKSARYAKKLLAQREAEWEQKKYLDEIGESEQQVHYTFAELVSWYLGLPVAKNKRSYDKDVQRSRYLLDYFGSMRADKIKPSMVESFQHEMLGRKTRRGKPYKPATVNRMLALLKRIFNLAIREDMVLKNPCWKVSMLPENNERDRVLTAGELEKLINELAQHLIPIVLVGYYTGMRREEILGLTWKRVNMEIGFIDLEPENTKTSEPRRLYFNDILWDVFEKARRIRGLHHDFVFTNKGRPIRHIRKGFNAACDRAGIENFLFHDLRHTFNTNMRRAGVDHTVIMKLTGHKTMAMFNRYNTVDKEDAQAAMRRLDGYLAAQNSLKSSDIVQTDQKSPQKEGLSESANPLKSLGAGGETRTLMGIKPGGF